MKEFGNRDIGYALRFIGCLVGHYYAMNHGEGDLGFAVSGALAGKMIGEGIEYLLYQGIKK